jgi:hypothetical protein
MMVFCLVPLKGGPPAAPGHVQASLGRVTHEAHGRVVPGSALGLLPQFMEAVNDGTCGRGCRGRGNLHLHVLYTF